MGVNHKCGNEQRVQRQLWVDVINAWESIMSPRWLTCMRIRSMCANGTSAIKHELCVSVTGMRQDRRCEWMCNRWKEGVQANRVVKRLEQKWSVCAYKTGIMSRVCKECWAMTATSISCDSWGLMLVWKCVMLLVWHQFKCELFHYGVFCYHEIGKCSRCEFVDRRIQICLQVWKKEFQ